MGKSRDVNKIFDREIFLFWVMVVTGYSKIHLWLRKNSIRTQLILSQQFLHVSLQNFTLFVLPNWLSRNSLATS